MASAGESSPHSEDDCEEPWNTNTSFTSYYSKSGAADSKIIQPLPESSEAGAATTVGLPGTRGVVVMFAEVFNDNSVCEIVLTLLHQPEFGAAVESSYLDSMRARGAPAAVLKRATALSRRVLRDDPDFEDLQELLLTPRGASKAEQLAWCARPWAPLAAICPHTRSVALFFVGAGTTACSSMRATCGSPCSCSS
tara:strand:+ start:88 stop:672 length:585 start_codon:yes stop_codon:yes gene_type:complete